MKQHVPITSEISHEELTSILHNWNKYQVVTVLESYQELSKRTLQTPSLLSILVEIKIQKMCLNFVKQTNFIGLKILLNRITNLIKPRLILTRIIRQMNLAFVGYSKITTIIRVINASP